LPWAATALQRLIVSVLSRIVLSREAESLVPQASLNAQRIYQTV
jgi:hypothetical protein